MQKALQGRAQSIETGLLSLQSRADQAVEEPYAASQPEHPTKPVQSHQGRTANEQRAIQVKLIIDGQDNASREHAPIAADRDDRGS